MFVENAMKEELLDTSGIDKMMKTLTTVKETLRKDNMVIHLFFLITILLKLVIPDHIVVILSYKSKHFQK